MATPEHKDETAKAIEQLATTMRNGLKWLGTGDAASQMGAIEFLGTCITDGCKSISASLDNLAEAIREREHSKK